MTNNTTSAQKIVLRQKKGQTGRVIEKIVVNLLFANSVGLLKNRRKKIKLQKCIIYNIDFSNFWFGESIRFRRDTLQ